MTTAFTVTNKEINSIDLNKLPEDHKIISQNDDFVSIRVEYKGGAVEYTAYYNLDDALDERDALLLCSKNPMDKIKGLLKDDLFPDSKDWVRGDVVERVSWLLSMYRSQKAECNMVWEMLDKANQECEKFQEKYMKEKYEI